MDLSCSLLYARLLEVISKYELTTGVLSAGTGNTEMNEMQFLIHVRTSKYLQNVLPSKPFSKLNILCVFSLSDSLKAKLSCGTSLYPQETQALKQYTVSTMLSFGRCFI